MKKVILNIVAASMICFVYACSSESEPEIVICSVPNAEPIELTSMQGKKVDADNRFTFNIFKEVSKLNGTNTFFSPLSLNMT